MFAIGAGAIGIGIGDEEFEAAAIKTKPRAGSGKKSACASSAAITSKLGKEELWPIANLELELLPCLIEMTWRGKSK